MQATGLVTKWTAVATAKTLKVQFDQPRILEISSKQMFGPCRLATQAFGRVSNFGGKLPDVLWVPTMLGGHGAFGRSRRCKVAENRQYRSCNCERLSSVEHVHRHIFFNVIGGGRPIFSGRSLFNQTAPRVFDWVGIFRQSSLMPVLLVNAAFMSSSAFCIDTAAKTVMSLSCAGAVDAPKVADSATSTAASLVARFIVGPGRRQSERTVSHKSHVKASFDRREHHDLVRLGTSPLHARRPDWHTGDGKPNCTWLFIEEAF